MGLSASPLATGRAGAAPEVLWASVSSAAVLEQSQVSLSPRVLASVTLRPARALRELFPLAGVCPAPGCVYLSGILESETMRDLGPLQGACLTCPSWRRGGEEDWSESWL